MSWQEFYDILHHNRELLSDFLQLNGYYDVIKGYLLDIEKNVEEKNIINKLLLGTYGLEINKQRAIYELPTIELVRCIEHICHTQNINEVVETCAGQGLLAEMIGRLTKLNVSATDGQLWSQTSGLPTYCKVDKKLIIDHGTGDEQFTNKLVVIAWITPIMMTDLKMLLELKNVDNILLIGEAYCDAIRTTMRQLKGFGYNLNNISAKQLCFRDYFRNNKLFPDECCRSSIILCTKNTTNIIETINPDLLTRPFKCYTDKMYLQDLIMNGTLPSWCQSLFESDDLKIFIKQIAKCILKKYIVPCYIDNYIDFEYWYNKKIAKKYPKNISTYDKFCEYKNLLDKLYSDNGLQLLRDQYIVPSWVDTIVLAEKYIWLDFSSTKKTWKVSIGKFMSEFNAIFSDS